MYTLYKKNGKDSGIDSHVTVYITLYIMWDLHYIMLLHYMKFCLRRLERGSCAGLEQVRGHVVTACEKVICQEVWVTSRSWEQAPDGSQKKTGAQSYNHRNWIPLTAMWAGRGPELHKRMQPGRNLDCHLVRHWAEHSAEPCLDSWPAETVR